MSTATDANIYVSSLSAYYSNIQDAIDAVSSAGISAATLQLMVPSLATGQVTVPANLRINLYGQDPSGTLLTMTEDTGSQGDDRAWFMCGEGSFFYPYNITFDGGDHLVYQAVRMKGGGCFDTCTFRNIHYNSSGPDYQGTAIVAMPEDPGNIEAQVTVRWCTFENIGREGTNFYGAGTVGYYLGNIYKGKGEGNFLDYAVEVGAGAGCLIQDSYMGACQGTASDGSGSAAVLATTYYGPGTQVTIEACNITDNATGVQVGTGSGIPDTSIAQILGNRIHGNSVGVACYSTNNIRSWMEKNWWGSNNGPNSSSNNDTSVGDYPIESKGWLQIGMNLATEDGELLGQAPPLTPTISLPPGTYYLLGGYLTGDAMPKGVQQHRQTVAPPMFEFSLFEPTDGFGSVSPESAEMTYFPQVGKVGAVAKLVLETPGATADPRVQLDGQMLQGGTITVSDG